MESIPPLPTNLQQIERKNFGVYLEFQKNDPANEKSVLDSLEVWIKLNGKTENIFLIRWQNTPTILQNGPQCGIVALCMAAQTLGIKVDTDSIFQQALHMGITKQGELFSSSALCALASHLKINCLLLDNGFSDIQQLLRYFKSGKLLLVPYDADCNHAPCLKNGHKAHWTLLVGVLLEFENNIKFHSELGFKWEFISKNLYRISDLPTNSNLFSQVSKENIYFIAKHGKSKRLAIWNFKSLELSNSNLKEVDPIKRANCTEYVLPPNNKLSDLCGKVIILG